MLPYQVPADSCKQEIKEKRSQDTATRGPKHWPDQPLNISTSIHFVHKKRGAGGRKHWSCRHAAQNNPCRSCQIEAATYRARTKPPLPALLASSCCGPCALQARPRSQGALRVGASWRRTPFAVRRCFAPLATFTAPTPRVNQRRGTECNHPVSRRPACACDVWRTLPCHPS